MTNTFTKITVALVITVAILASFAFTIQYQPNVAEGASGSPFGTRKCEISTSTKMVVGHQTSKTVLAAHSNRAWAKIQQPANASNTAYLSMDGAAATAQESLILTRATSTSPVPLIIFGLNTELPYVGAVTLLNSTGSSTVLVTECRY